ncbi:MAG: hypothetical protein HY898_35970 [Deltaproteobacteria bacterium]|nr:hypothetical protein [Deltaproteobacteria bacterium]
MATAILAGCSSNPSAVSGAGRTGVDPGNAAFPDGAVAVRGSTNQARDGDPARGNGGSDPERGGQAAGDGRSGSPRNAAIHCAAPKLHQGKASFYPATGAGNCSFEASAQDRMIGAMNRTEYAGSAVCGTCVLVHGPKADITIRIVDQCPECSVGQIDLSQEAFAKIADIPRGIVPITWSFVPCSVQGPIVYHFMNGSTQWWTAVQIRNHQHAIQKLEYLGSDWRFHSVPRLDYNFFVQASGMGPGPYTFRVTDIHGHVLQDAGIPGGDNVDSPGRRQFPACLP